MMGSSQGSEGKRARTLAARAVLLLGLSAPSWAGEAPATSLPIWNFDHGVTNQFGGRYNAYMRDPSWARTYLDPTVHHALGSHSLRVTVHREREGFCGIWLKFFPELRETRQFLDASPYRFLSFWIKGERGGEHFEFELTDEAHLDKEDPALTRPLRAYLSPGVSTQWQEVLIPLQDYWRLDLRRLTQLTLRFTSPGDYRFYLDDLALKPEKSTSVPALEKVATHVPADAFSEARGRMWVWHTNDLTEGKPENTEKCFAFCAANRIREVYLSLDLSHPPTANGLPVELRNPPKYRELIARGHHEGLRVEALGGSPEWADRENHPLALAVIDAVLAFNRSAPPEARFDGVHFDVEPYLLVEYADPEYRAELLSDFLQMVLECQNRLRPDRLAFSCDVPAWFYPVDPEVRKELAVTFQGETKTVGEHLTDLLDTVTIMDYRNEADGANGIISFGSAAVAYAASRGRKIVIGLETSLDPDRIVYFIAGLPADEFHRRLAASPLRHQRYVAGFRMSAFRSANDVHVGLEQPDRLDEPARAAFDKALGSLARQFGAASEPEHFPAPAILDEARRALSDDPEWKGFDPFEIVDPETQQKVAGFRSIYRMPHKITFYGLGRQALIEETRSTMEWLGRYSSFDGLAFHHYDSLQALLAQ